jgi:uncharacterized protein YutE (UPF0331/DUF86 family)
MNVQMVEGKLRKIEQFLRELEDADRPKGFEAFSRNIVFKRFVERNIELAAEQMVDICRHIVSALDLREPKSYAECFEMLGEAEVVPKEHVSVFQKMARFRNFLIHGYDGVDDAVTFGVYTRNLDDFRLFVAVIRRYFSREAPEETPPSKKGV